MKIQFVPAAQTDLTATVAWYEAERPGLGRQFALEVEAAVARIFAFPLANPVFSESSRRCTTRRFPDGVVYALRETEILVLAVMHLHREPGAIASRDQR